MSIGTLLQRNDIPPAVVAKNLGLLIYAAGEIFLTAPLKECKIEGQIDMEDRYLSEEEKYFSTCGQVTAATIYAMQSWKFVKEFPFITLAFASFLAKLVKVRIYFTIIISQCSEKYKQEIH